jgi:hypothetical protein
MKTIHLLSVMMVMVVGFVLMSVCGCETQASNPTSGQRTYSSEDLNRTGKRTTGEQLQAVDPAVTAQGSNR